MGSFCWTHIRTNEFGIRLNFENYEKEITKKMSKLYLVKHYVRL